jgi:stage V sporulation protein D (sporulation-specific penicillin-binding protein)
MSSYFRRKRERFIWLFIITLLLFTLLIHRLIHIQANESERFTELAQYQHKGSVTLNALRGAIYDRNGSCFAYSLAHPSVAANPKKIEDIADTAKQISKILNIDEKQLVEDFSYPATFIWLARKVNPETASEIRKLNLPGIFLVNEESGKRFHPKEKIACHVVGFTGVDDQGLEGVEATYEDLLSGKSGLLEAEMDEPGRILPIGDINHIPPVPGKDIYLTIDESVQFIVERELAKVVKEFKAAGGTVIVYDPRNGDILALANLPDYNPVNTVGVTKRQLRNKAVVDSYEPGSTFKVFTGAAALDSGKIKPTDMFHAGDSIHVGGYSLRNAVDGLSLTGKEDVKGMIVYSFNTTAAAIGLKMGEKVFYDYLAKLGFGEVTGIDLPGEAEGIMAHVDYWKPINLATISYGQGISVTPIQMVRAVGAICNDGILMKPRIVRKIVNHDGTVYRSSEPEPGVKVFDTRTCHEILKSMAGVVEEGTAKRAAVPGYRVGGKTGTANVVVDGVYASGKYISSFVGAAPIDDPRIVVLIKIDEPEGPGWGGTVAAPLFGKICSQILWRLGVHPEEQKDLTELINGKDKNNGE